MTSGRSSICIILLTILTSLSQTRVTGFRMRLIPVDSPESPLSTSADTRYELLANISLARTLRHLRKTPHLPIHLQAPALGGLSFINYFITPLQIGTDSGSFTAHVVLDTGSPDLWVQCKGCTSCIKVKGGSFDPYASPSYKEVSFRDTALCRPPMQWRDTHACMYRVSYGGGQSTSGPVGTDVVFFEDATGSSGEFFFVAFGFGFDNRNFRLDRDSENVISGVLGLAVEEPRSFMYQVREAAKYRFSYCLPLPGGDSTTTTASAMYFGDDANATGPGWQTMPMLSDGNSYHLYLEGISLNGTLLPIDADVFEYNYQLRRAFYIDIGSPFTLLERSAYEELMGAMTQYFERLGIEASRAWWPPYHQCYTSNLRPGQQYPSVTLHFQGGAQLFLAPDTLFTPHSAGFCVPIMPTNGPSLLGAWQQANHQFLYDINVGGLPLLPGTVWELVDHTKCHLMGGG